MLVGFAACIAGSVCAPAMPEDDCMQGDFVAIAVGHFHSLALRSDGTIVG